MSLYDLMASHKGKLSDKWHLYVTEYDRIFSPLRNRPITLLEIGIHNGGSLEIWSNYFPNAKKIVGCDVNPACSDLAYNDSRIALIIGDVNSDKTQEKILQQSALYDIVIDDGSHNSGDIVKSFSRYFPVLVDDGVYIAEDLHASYWKETDGGLFNPYSSVSFFKLLTDIINHEHWGIQRTRNELISGFNNQYKIQINEDVLDQIHSIEFINSLCIIRKSNSKNNHLGPRFIVGDIAKIDPNWKTLNGTSSPTPNQNDNYWSKLVSSPAESYLHYLEVASSQDSNIAGLNQAAIERETHITNLNLTVLALEGDIAYLNQQITNIYASTSWRITSPFRWLIRPIQLIRSGDFLSKSVPNYLRSHPKIRVQIYSWALKLDVTKKLAFLYRADKNLPNPSIPYRPSLLPSTYQEWSSKFDTPAMEVMDRLAATTNSKSSVIVVAYFDKDSECHAEALARRLIESIGQQWTACFLFSGNSNKSEVIEKIRLSTDADSRILFDPSKVNQHAETIIHIEGGALPRRHALRIFADTLRNNPEALLAYSDEDYLLDDGHSSDPWLKPDYSPLLASQNLLFGRMIAFKVAAKSKNILEQLLSTSLNRRKFISEYVDTVEESHIRHIPHVLFHDLYKRHSITAINFDLPKILPKTTIIIPTKDYWDVLGPCLDSLFTTDWPRELLDIVVIDNGSTDTTTLSKLNSLQLDNKIRVIRDARAFNWSCLNNVGAAESDGDLLIFLNNDTVVNDKNWLKKITPYALRHGSGAVGCKLLYPDLTVQHGGVIAGIGGVAGHAHLFLAQDEGGYCDLANITHEVSAVTGAFLAITRKNFDLVGGFDEDFQVAFGDVAFCLSLQSMGLKNIYFAEPLFIHHESKTRGYDDTPKKKMIFFIECYKSMEKHPAMISNDPYYSPNLSLTAPYELTNIPRRDTPWEDKKNSPIKILILSCTHAVGHGVAVVINIQANALIKRGFEVIIAGPRSTNDFTYPGCTRYELEDPSHAAALAAELSVNVIIAHTMPFFDISKWIGNYPPLICYDYGEPPPDLFPDGKLRKEQLFFKDLSLLRATKIYTISEAVATESRIPISGIIELGNSHLGQWSNDNYKRREAVRQKHGWHDHCVILNVCRFHQGERYYKGIDTYLSLLAACNENNLIQSKNLVFVLCGKSNDEDVAEMTRLGLKVFANVSDDEMVDLYCAADAYINFSKWEGYNLGIAQALAMGLPTMASDIPAHRAFDIFTSNNMTDCASWIMQLLNKKETRKSRIWSWDQHTAKLVSIIENV